MQELEISAGCDAVHLNKYNDYSPVTLENCITEYDTFFENIIQKNLPCIIKNISKEWECNTKWLINNKINFEYLKQNYGSIEAPVADCNSITYNAQNKTNMRVSEYMTYLENEKKDKLLYLKDWHLRKLRPNDNFYTVPKYFASDWLNEFTRDQEEDDFMFVYIGPKDSWTPLHVDVYNSYSWSVNVIGQKQWILFPPGEEEKLKDSLGNLPLLFTSDRFENIKYFKIVQEKGEALFVPSGWHHQVVNELDTISINHNWINASNLEAVWTAMQKSLLSVENEIEEFKDNPDFADQCQMILKSLFGMDFTYFVKFLCHIGQKRIKQIKTMECSVSDSFRFGVNHIKFDLKAILKMMHLITNHPLRATYLLPDLETSFTNLKCKISEVINLTL